MKHVHGLVVIISQFQFSVRYRLWANCFGSRECERNLNARPISVGAHTGVCEHLRRHFPEGYGEKAGPTFPHDSEDDGGREDSDCDDKPDRLESKRSNQVERVPLHDVGNGNVIIGKRCNCYQGRVTLNRSLSVILSAQISR